MANTHDIQKSTRICKSSYSFAVVGGAVSTIVLPGSDILPSGAIVTEVIADCTTTATSGGSATFTVKAGGVTLSAATAVASLTGTLTLALASSATAVKATSSAGITVSIAVAALTAGVIDIYIGYII